MTYSVRNIAIALALAVAAAAAVLLYTSSYKDQVTRDQERVQVMVANQDIPAGTPGEKAAGMMAVKDVLRTDVTPGALQSSAGLEGKVAAHDVYADQQVVSQVFRTPTDQAAALSLDKTERGIRVNVDFASGALGAIKAGDHVDYFATFKIVPPGTGNSSGVLMFTRRLMTDVRVLEAPVPDPESGPGKLSEEDKDAKQQTLMLAVTQADATKLAYVEAAKAADDQNSVVSWVVVRPPEGQASEMPITLENIKSMLEDGVPLNELKTKYANYIALIEQAEIDAQNRANDAAASAGIDSTADPTTGGGSEDAGAGDASNPPAQLEPPTDTDPLSE